ncbi:hypothetical protein IW148_003450 [Coemansia sp. RSA 1199]|nr:hypothetical protein IW148_003450 [Coemansia sp. RSA 1199]
MSALMAVDAATSQSSSPNMDANGYSSTTSSTPSVYVEIIRSPRRAGTSEFAPEVSVQSKPSQDSSNTATPLLLGVHRNTELILQTPLNNHNLPQQVVQQASSSSTKAHGTIIDVTGDFGTIARQGGLVLDKSLICKALLDTPSAPIRVCLPRRFGKTFNLSVIEEFFNVVTCKDAEPVDGSIDEAAGRANRMKLFKDSLLHEEYPEFFEEHFCKTPVIRITMKNVKATSVEEFYKALVGSIYDTAKIWVSNAKNVDWSAFVKDEWDDLKEITSEAKKILADMYKGDIRGLYADISEIMNMMPSMYNYNLEGEYGNIFRTYILAKFFDRSRSPSESASPDFLSEIQSGMGDSNLVITFPATGRFPESLVVIIEFKRIEADKLYDVDYPLKRARQGLEQIIEKDYARSRGSSGLRLDIGIAMGCGKVVMRQRLWRRARGQLAATRRNENDTLTPKRHRGESVADWDVRLNNADDSGWQDANGWKTALLPSEFRTALGS